MRIETVQVDIQIYNSILIGGVNMDIYGNACLNP